MALDALLKDFDNFGQTEFTPDILEGKLTTTIDLHMHFDRKFNVIEDSVVALADVLIENGRLKNYSTLESLSSLLNSRIYKTSSLKNLRTPLKFETEPFTCRPWQLKTVP